MDHAVRIQMMGNYLIYIDERCVENPVQRSRKGSALLMLLILHRGQPVSNQLILRSLWSGGVVTNPENALKTLVSRVRAMLNQISEGMGECVVSDRGAYHWAQQQDVRVDVLELTELFDTLERERDRERRRTLYGRMMKLYKGDLYQTGTLEEEAEQADRLHRKYLDRVYEYLDLLWEEDACSEINAVCRTALEVDGFDDRLHIELMKSMMRCNRISEAMAEYKHATDMNYRYQGVEPSRDMRTFYTQLNRSRKSMQCNLEAIREELNKSDGEHGALVCEYPVFKEIYDLQMRNLERLGTSMFLGIIMVGDPEEERKHMFRLDNIMAGLIEILRDNLRKGDIITRFAPNTVALLLPTVNYDTGTMVLERIRQLFYKRYPTSAIPFYYELGDLLNRTVEQQG